MRDGQKKKFTPWFLLTLMVCGALRECMAFFDTKAGERGW